MSVQNFIAIHLIAVYFKQVLANEAMKPAKLSAHADRIREVSHLLLTVLRFHSVMFISTQSRTKEGEGRASEPTQPTCVDSQSFVTHMHKYQQRN